MPSVPESLRLFAALLVCDGAWIAGYVLDSYKYIWSESRYGHMMMMMMMMLDGCNLIWAFFSPGY